MRKLLSSSVNADYIIRAGGPRRPMDGFMRLPRQGPILTWRAVCDTDMPVLHDWDVTMGDIELF